MRVRGVSARTRAAIRRVEDQWMWPNAVADALSLAEWAFEQPGRYLDATAFESPGLGDARDDLEWAMRHLPPGARRDLGRLVTRIDAEIERRTLPDPHLTELTASGWWWTRMPGL
ncbi:hypothetical protein [Streptomyces sp. NPDC048185]|uniref:hypothetical protein n=1 Tax=Streptomyces sp. NPDC048185 TaxID=3365508 RepID=UPI003719B190